MSVGINTGAGQTTGQSYQTGNPQSIGTPSLQQTQSLQGGSGQVLGINSVLSQPRTTAELSVQSSATSQSILPTETETTPVQPASFNVPPIFIYIVGGLLVLAAVSFVWSRVGEANHS
jgi:hypothetical protein